MLETKIPQYWIIAKWIALWFICLFYDPLLIRQPFDVSVADQVSIAKFAVKKTEKYKLSLLFVRPDGLEHILEQERTIGSQHHDGVPIHLELTIQRDRKIISNTLLTASGIDWGITFSLNGRQLNTAERLIRIVELQPGDYEITIKTSHDNEAFKEIETYISYAYYNHTP
ncbi:DUF5625 family protein [Pseudomonas sp.]|uniref:DUF5625 family protein n=1 Tax=Pseudomonas sp. TaxID=306 RepID=UPI0028A65BEF|nr:DUF5625 family protein [Pseudomonas sp.]